MGYGVRIIHADGRDVTLPEKHDIAGGTCAVGGTRNAWLYVTYNYGSIFRRLLGEGGINTLNGKRVKDAMPIIEKAIAALGDAKPDADYWKATDGNVCKALANLKKLADLAMRAFPDDEMTWSID